MGPAPPFDVFQSSTLLFYFEHVLLLLFSSALKMCFSPQDTQHSSIDVLKARFFSGLFPQESVLTQCLGGEMHFKRLFFMEFVLWIAVQDDSQSEEGKGEPSVTGWVWTDDDIFTLHVLEPMNWEARSAVPHFLRYIPQLTDLTLTSWFTCIHFVGPCQHQHVYGWWIKNTVNEMAAMPSKLINGLPI